MIAEIAFSTNDIRVQGNDLLMNILRPSGRECSRKNRCPYAINLCVHIAASTRVIVIALVWIRLSTFIVRTEKMERALRKHIKMSEDKSHEWMGGLMKG